MVEMSVVTHIEPEVLTFSTHATLTTSVGTTTSGAEALPLCCSGLAHEEPHQRDYAEVKRPPGFEGYWSPSQEVLCPRQDSNLRPSAPEADALSPELRGLVGPPKATTSRTVLRPR